MTRRKGRGDCETLLFSFCEELLRGANCSKENDAEEDEVLSLVVITDLSVGRSPESLE